MQQPTLAILAAGMGRRFGGLKQMTPVDEQGNFIMDYSLFDAMHAGFSRVVFIINHEIDEEFRRLIGRRVQGKLEVNYAYQELSMLPDGFAIPQERVRPWGTGHALLCAREQLPGPFAIINADDYYGPHAYKAIYKFLTEEEAAGEHAMVSYPVECTLPQRGTVSRGVCTQQGEYLQHIEEIKVLYPKGSGAAYERDGQEVLVPAGTPISMSFWGFRHSIFAGVERLFPAFLEEALAQDPLAGEYLLPSVVQQLMEQDGIRVRMLQNEDRWHGVTNREDLPVVVEALQALHNAGVYPASLWA